MLRTKTALIGDDRPQSDEGARQDRRAPRRRAAARTPWTEWPLRQDIEGEAPDEGPDETGLETERDRHDDAEDEDRVRLCVADPQVRHDSQFEQRRHHRADRSEEQGHEMGRSSAKRPKVARPPDPAPRDDRSAATSGGVSHGTADRAMRVAVGAMRADVSRETRRPTPRSMRGPAVSRETVTSDVADARYVPGERAGDHTASSRPRPR